MVFRTAGATATLMICLAGAGGQALAQYYPPPQAYPPQAYPPPQGYTPRQPLPPMADAEEDAPPLNAPVMQAPLPPVGLRIASERAAGRHPLRNSRTAAVQRRPGVLPCAAAARLRRCRNARLLRRARRHPARPCWFGRTGRNSARRDAAATAD